MIYERGQFNKREGYANESGAAPCLLELQGNRTTGRSTAINTGPFRAKLKVCVFLTAPYYLRRLHRKRPRHDQEWWVWKGFEVGKLLVVCLPRVHVEIVRKPRLSSCREVVSGIPLEYRFRVLSFHVPERYSLAVSQNKQQLWYDLVAVLRRTESSVGHWTVWYKYDWGRFKVTKTLCSL
jgi:hypothetical protein